MNQANRTGSYRMNKVDGVRPPYRTGDLKINQRRLKRLKNKLWKMCKRRKEIIFKIKTHLSEDKFANDIENNIKGCVNFLIYTEFYQKWRKWKQANPKILVEILNSKHANIYHIYKLMNQTEVTA